MIIIHSITNFAQLFEVLELVLSSRVASLCQLPLHSCVYHNGHKYALEEITESLSAIFPKDAIVQWTECGVYIYPRTLLSALMEGSDKIYANSTILSYFDFAYLF